MKAGKACTAYFLIILMLFSVIAVAAEPPEDRDGEHGLSIAEEHRRGRNQNDGDEDRDDEDEDISRGGEALREKAEKAIEVAEELLEEVKDLLKRIENLGLPIDEMLIGLIEEAEEALREARDLLEEFPMKALSLAKRAEAIAKMVINQLESILESAPQPGEAAVDERLERLREVFEKLDEEFHELLEELEELAEEGLNITLIENLMEKISELLDQTLSLIESQEDLDQIEENLDEVEELLEEVKELIESLREEVIVSPTTTINVTEAPPTPQPATITTSQTINMTSITMTSPSPVINITAELNITSYTTSIEKRNETRTRANITTPPRAEVSVNVTVRAGRGVHEVVIEQSMLKKVDGNISMVKEIIVSAGNKTLIKLSKEMEAANGTRIMREIIIERNQSLVGALIKLEMENASMVEIDKSLEVEILGLEENRLKLRLEAPNGTPGRIIVVELDPEAVDLSKIREFKVLVNNRPAILASSIMDLALEVYDEPAYVFIISAKGAQILLYIPHFSSYLVEIVGIVEEVRSAVAEALSRALTRDVLVASTITATIILLIAAVASIRRRAALIRAEPL